jgi:hypothetical protein
VLGHISPGIGPGSGPPSRPPPEPGCCGAKQIPESIAAELTVPERILLFGLASETDWQKVGVTYATAQHMMVRNLIERDQAASRFVLTEQRRTRHATTKP